VVTLPRVVVAAPSSGSGKTTVTIGLVAALAARGLAVATAKVGPDYIDPGYHALASGRPGRNLDPVLCGEELVGPLLAHGAAGADVAVVEGVMGLFDGKGGTAYGSTAHVATLIGAPVLLVVDARAMSGSVAALVRGFATHDPAVDVAGVVLNRVGSDAHERMLREALAALDIPVVGAIRRDDELTTPARHLGLVPAAERVAAARRATAALAEVVARSVDLAAVMRIARAAGDLAAGPWSPAVPSPAPAATRVGVMTGPAFGFVYPENVELLQAAGAEVVPVDQDDERLPAGLATLYVPGGFPEIYAHELAGNARLRAAVRAHVAAGGAVYAECGGLLWLAAELDGRPMCGVVSATARLTERLTLGYRIAEVAGERSLVGAPGDVVNAHEFHYAAIEPAAGERPAWRIGDRVEGWADGRVHASFLHTHWAGAPAIAANVARGHRAVATAAGRPA
jgi:cobyrinic acid a,c-diamide synthase